jgi:hypothetical protein
VRAGNKERMPGLGPWLVFLSRGRGLKVRDPSSSSLVYAGEILFKRSNGSLPGYPLAQKTCRAEGTSERQTQSSYSS